MTDRGDLRHAAADVEHGAEQRMIARQILGIGYCAGGKALPSCSPTPATPTAPEIIGPQKSPLSR